MKFCKECGKEMFDDAMICPNCGTYQEELLKADEAEMADPAPEVDTAIELSAEVPSHEGIAPATFSGAAYTYGDDPSVDTRFNVPTGGTSYPVPKYNFWLFFFLTIVTCGIFGIYYMYKWTEDTNRLSQGVYKPSMNYVFVFLLGLVTCGIYPMVWTYQQGERLKVVGDANGIKINETGVHHLLLTLLLGSVGGLVSTYIFFNNTNRLSGVYNGTLTRDQANQKTSHVPAIIIGVVLSILAGAVLVGTAIYQLRNVNFNDYNGGGIYDFEDWEEFEDWDDYDWDEMDLGDGSSEFASFEDASVEIIDALKIKDANGNPALAVTIVWDNMSEKSTSAMWTFDIEAYQNGHSLETTWPVKGDPDVDMANYSTNIDPNDSIEFQVVFKLVNESDDVQIVVKKMLSSEDGKAVCTFTL